MHQESDDPNSHMSLKGFVQFSLCIFLLNKRAPELDFLVESIETTASRLPSYNTHIYIQI